MAPNSLSTSFSFPFDTDVQESLKRWSANGLKAGLATLIRVKRSAPRPPGARFAANEKGDVAGSISSGCIEGDLFEHIQQVVDAGEPRLVEYGITDEMAGEVGLACGGEIEVLVAPYDPDDDVWPALGRLTSEGSAAVLITGISDPVSARQLLLFPDGSRVGTLGAEALDVAAEALGVPLLDTGGTRIVGLEDPDATVFAEAFLPPPKLAVVGATPVAAALCHLASYMGMAVTVIDPREVFAKEERFPDADRVLCLWPEEGLVEIGLDRYWSVVVLAHDRNLDVPALAAALRAGCLYIGQIGGARTQRLRREALQELGISEERIRRVRGPVGLDIGAVGPEEIALSIMAELLAVRHGKTI